MKLFCSTNQQIKHLLINNILIVILLPLLVINSNNTLSFADANETGQVYCYDKGFVDGEDHPFDQGIYGKCGDDYYEGFLAGCMSVKDNSLEICDSATDA